MIIKNYIINKGYYKQFKRLIEFVNDYQLFYNFKTFDNKNTSVMDNLTFTQCKKGVTNSITPHYMVIQVKYSNRQTKITNQGLFQGI